MIVDMWHKRDKPVYEGGFGFNWHNFRGRNLLSRGGATDVRDRYPDIGSKSLLRGCDSGP